MYFIETYGCVGKTDQMLFVLQKQQSGIAVSIGKIGVRVR